MIPWEVVSIALFKTLNLGVRVTKFFLVYLWMWRSTFISCAKLFPPVQIFCHFLLKVWVGSNLCSPRTKLTYTGLKSFLDMYSFHSPDLKVNVYGVNLEATPKESEPGCKIQKVDMSLFCDHKYTCYVFYTGSLVSSDIKGNHIIPCFNLM